MNCCKCGVENAWEWSDNCPDCPDCVDQDFEAWLINFMDQDGGMIDVSL